jgi:hypothetical protein
MNTNRAFTVAEQGHLDRCRAMVDEAMQHLGAASDAHDEGDDKGVASAHARLRGCLRSAQRSFESLAKAGAQADLDANHKVQTSAGVTEGTSSKPRMTPGLMTGDAKVWLERARQGSRR